MRVDSPPAASLATIVSELLPILKGPSFRSCRIYLNRIGLLADCTGKGMDLTICTGEDDTLELETVDTDNRGDTVLLLIQVIPCSPEDDRPQPEAQPPQLHFK